jgi:hypothetical protein
MGDDLVFDLVGARQVEEAFAAFAATMRRSFHLNGQHVVELDGDAATGITYCQVKHVSDADGHEVITDSSVRYDDTYVRRDGRWFISRRIARFTMHETRALHPAS